MRRLILIVFTLMIALPANAQECVVLLHGLAKTERDMRKLERRLTSDAVSSALENCGDYKEVHFVTHSMGGILVRQYLLNHEIDKLGRVVMLGPPNQGSEAVDSYQDVPGFKMIGGPAGLQLGTGVLSVPRQLGAVEFDLGIIAGTRSVNLILSTILPGKDDGKVSVESTKVDGMNDHIAMPVTHPFMMKNKRVINQVVHFIRAGEFSRE